MIAVQVDSYTLHAPPAWALFPLLITASDKYCHINSIGILVG
jgi:hypothetical protein